MLNKDQKEAIKSLVQHPWWKVVELINETDLNELGRNLLNADLTNLETIKIIQENQIYTKARNDFVRSIRDNTASYYNPKI